MKGNTRVSMVLARMLTAILAVTGLAVVAPVAHAVDSPAITLDACSIPIRSADTSHAYTAYLVAEYDLSTDRGRRLRHQRYSQRGCARQKPASA